MDMTRSRTRTLLAIALVVTAAGVGFVLRGGFALGLFLAIAAMEAALLLFLAPEARTRLQALPPAARQARRLLLAALAAVILLLAAAFVLFRNEALQALDFLTIVGLYAVQLLLVSGSSAYDWDHPGFWLEAALAYPARPFVSLAAIPAAFRRAFGTNRPDISVAGTGRTAETAGSAGDSQALPASRSSTVVMALLGILLAVPVLLLAGSLLASADSVFGRLLSDLSSFWRTLAFQDWLISAALTVAFFPFVFSFLESARSRWLALARPGSAANPSSVEGPDGRRWQDPAAAASASGSRRFALNPVMLVSFLASINVLYLAFALVQLTYLTGAFRLSLPDGLSYAEYARSGFFELSGLALINAALIMLAVKGAPRPDAGAETENGGSAGAAAGTRIARILRILSLMLVAGSLVQWASALFRMSMYVSAYGLTMLRFFVTAFMLLMAVIFALLTVKEFRPRFPLFKSVAIAAVVALVLLNYVNPDAWIARHNIGRSVADPAVTLDLTYFRALSPDATRVLIENLPRLTADQQKAVLSDLTLKYKQRQQLPASAYLNRWQNWNLSSWRTDRLIEGATAPYR